MTFQNEKDLKITMYTFSYFMDSKAMTKEKAIRVYAYTFPKHFTKNLAEAN